MIAFSPVTPADRERIFPRLYAAGHIGCETAFVNLCTWLSAYGGAAVVRDFLCVRCLDGYLYPIGKEDVFPALSELRQDASERGQLLRFYCVSPEERAELERVMPDAFSFTESRNDFDYLYPVSQLASLAGKKLQAKRNHCNRFEAEYDFALSPMTSADVPRCLAFCEAWYAERSEEDFSAEKRAMPMALENFDALQLEGLLLTVEGELAAFTVGSRLTETVYDVHYEKASTKFEGAYSVINRAFARMIAEKYPEVQLLNREDDLGLEGLRKAKLSYHPQMLEKYTAVWKEKK